MKHKEITVFSKEKKELAHLEEIWGIFSFKVHYFEDEKEDLNNLTSSSLLVLHLKKGESWPKKLLENMALPLLVLAESPLSFPFDAVKNQEPVRFFTLPVSPDEIKPAVLSLLSSPELTPSGRPYNKEHDLQGNNRWYRLLFEESVYSISVFNKRGEVLLINEKGSQFFQKSSEELTGMTLADLFPGKAPLLMERHLDALSLGKKSVYEDCMVLGGKEKWFRSIISPIDDLINEERGVQVVSYDISEEKEYERALKHNIAEKEVLIKEIHHRVKNNIQIISSLFDLQYGRLFDLRDKKLFIESQLRLRALALIHEKMYSNSNLKEVCFAEYIQDLLESYTMTIVDHRGKTEIEVDTDNAAVELNEAIPCALILNELMTNSLKYAWSEGQKGKLFIRIAPEEDSTVIRVKDDGIGFDWDKEKNAGSIGIQLVLALVDQLKGEIEVSSQNGTDITIRTRTGEKLAITSPTNERKTAGNGACILIVEDERITALNFQKLLNRYGYSVPMVASNAEDAVEAVRVLKPDLVLMDILIEGKKDGIEVSRYIQDSTNVPVIFTTANNDESVLARAMATNPAGYITKPVDNIALLNLIHDILEKRSREEAV